jgi:hypothetical protein
VDEELQTASFNCVTPPEDVIRNIQELLSPLPSASETSQEIRKIWGDRFASAGWIVNYLLPNSRQSISLWKGSVGLCVQLGNTCRASTDLLKLETLFRLGKIRHGCLVVPSNPYSKYLGTNHASFATATRDLSTFAAAISVPLTVFSVAPWLRGEKLG